ncbi:MAG: 16S rRNA (uracil(1498)-N(3))-methyltransferase [Spartobacteria bacterium]|nr:16S rRNA (uracil(1498)-N(3))-methyltransferase [Spartobacteria bacterium]
MPPWICRGIAREAWMNLILFEPGEIDADGRAVLRDERAEHVRQVLKAAPGQRLRIGVLDGPRGYAIVESVTPSHISVTTELDSALPPVPTVDLLLAAPRPKVLKRLWAQLAALGVRQIMLTKANKVERNYFDTHVMREAFYRPRLIEGLQQAADTRLPCVSIHRRFKVLIEDELDDRIGDALRIVAHPRGATPVYERLRESTAQHICLAVGPEGGWTDYELDLLTQHGFHTITMGHRILRTDTACVALLALVHEACSCAHPGNYHGTA